VKSLADLFQPRMTSEKWVGKQNWSSSRLGITAAVILYFVVVAEMWSNVTTMSLPLTAGQTGTSSVSSSWHYPDNSNNTVDNEFDMLGTRSRSPLVMSSTACTLPSHSQLSTGMLTSFRVYNETVLSNNLFHVSFRFYLYILLKRIRELVSGNS